MIKHLTWAKLKVMIVSGKAVTRTQLGPVDVEEGRVVEVTFEE